MGRDPMVAAVILLTHYSFESHGNSVEEFVPYWLKQYPTKWVIAAIIEALYQGRYKLHSVDRILDSWSARGQPIPHFDHDFADVVYKKTVRKLDAMREENHMQIEGSKPEAIEEEFQLPEVIPHIPQSSTEVIYPEKRNLPNPRIQEAARLVQKLAG